MVNAVKQANEFGLTKNQSMVALLIFISDVHSMELQAAQGLKFVTASTGIAPTTAAHSTYSDCRRRPDHTGSEILA
jgi:hypothetical protein